jgi:hypothetical protein
MPLPYLLVASSLLIAACSSDEVDSDEQARRAYLALDKSVGKSINLGFQGFNMASSANIDPQTAMGDKAGTITVTGQVDQGASNNKGMRLNIGMVGYDDGPFEIDADHNTMEVKYDTSTTMTDQPYLQLMLMSIPSGTLTGTLTSNTTMTGVYNLSGDITGSLTLNLTISGMLMPATAPAITTRVPGSTTVTGTATNADGGVYNIMITI